MAFRWVGSARINSPSKPTWPNSRPNVTGNPLILNALGVILSGWGLYTAALILRRPEELAQTENHPSWTHMYWMMMVAQVGFALAYLPWR
jgi:dolichyl-phosphate-mannose--protein O-mannosyl transferase